MHADWLLADGGFEDELNQLVKLGLSMGIECIEDGEGDLGVLQQTLDFAKIAFVDCEDDGEVPRAIDSFWFPELLEEGDAWEHSR